MKKYFQFAVLVAVLSMLFSIVCLGEVTPMPVDPTAVLPTDQFFSMLFASIGQFKGASVIVIIAIVTQLILAFFRTPLADFAGKYKLLIVLGLSLVGTIITAFATGASWPIAILSNGTIAALQVLLFEIYNQFVKKPAEVK